MPPTSTLVGPSGSRVVDVHGDDRLTYLDAVLSQALRDAPAGTATAALELGPHGEPLGELRLAVLDDRVVLVVSPAADETVERLAGRTFLSDARFTPRDDLAVRRARGPLADTGLPTTPGTAVEVDDVLVLVRHDGADLVGDPDALDALVGALVAAGCERADAAMLDAHEVALGTPRLGDEVVRGRLPEEVGLLPTHVHLAKGCYPGQEAVARMWMLGRPRRRLAVVRGPGVAQGTLGEGRTAVEVTRAADVDGPVGLAFVRPDVEAGDEPVPGVVVESLVGADLPVPGHDPSTTRRRDR